MEVKYPQTVMNKSQGFTDAEEFLARLCNNSFLSFWSYPNVFRDQGRTSSQRSEAKGDGKELCDLLVIFENHIIIFSDKQCVFPSNGDIQLDWSRWFRKAVKDAAHQIWGAERWIFNYPDSIFLDSKCTQRLPIQIPYKENAVIHRIVVAHGASEECIKQLGGTGSLMIHPSVIGDMHTGNQENPCIPFAVGQIDPNKGYVHVFDDFSLEVVMKTVDTISDFTRYLTKKEELILNGKLVAASGEEDLLAHYLQSIDEKGEHTFLSETDQGITAISVWEGLWEDFCNHPSRLAQIKANEISYSWDKLIEKFLFHITTGTSYLMSHPDIKSQEEVFRFLAKENRTRRRFLAESIHDLIKKTPDNARTTRTLLPVNPGDPCYLFLLMSKRTTLSYEEYREVRGQLLAGYLRITKLKFPEIKDIVGIATETGLSEERSEDFMYLNARDWTEEDDREAADLERKFSSQGLLGKRTLFRSNINEYPDTNPSRVTKGMKGNERNDPCPCKSGKKFKKCCGQL